MEVGHNIFQFSDYRAFLEEFYQREKERSAGFSYRSFARRAGLTSPNYLKLVIDGSRPVTAKNLSAFLRGLRLSGSAAEYFRLLVSIKETPDENEKAILVERLLKLRLKSSHKPSQVDKDRWDILRSWHHWAIREMVLLRDFQNDPTWIATRLGKKITAKQAEESLGILLRLGFLKEKKPGALEQSEPMITTSDEISNIIIRHLHRQFVEIGLISLFHDSVECREVNGLTIALTSDEIPAFKKMLKEFRQELNRQFSRSRAEADHVYHLENLFFPVTKPVREERREC